MSEDAVGKLRSAYTALGEGDEAAALAMLAPDCVWQESAELPDAGTFQGREAIGAFLRDFLASWRRFHQEILEVEARGERVLLVIHMEAIGRTSGIALDTRYAHLWTMRDGLGIRVDAYRDPEAARAVLAGPSTAPSAPSADASTQKTT